MFNVLIGQLPQVPNFLPHIFCKPNKVYVQLRKYFSIPYLKYSKYNLETVVQNVNMQSSNSKL